MVADVSPAGKGDQKGFRFMRSYLALVNPSLSTVGNQLTRKVTNYSKGGHNLLCMGAGRDILSNQVANCLVSMF
jgi:hypothetical protein